MMEFEGDVMSIVAEGSLQITTTQGLGESADQANVRLPHYSA